MNSALSIPRAFSCGLDSFPEIASCLFLPHLSTLAVRNYIHNVHLQVSMNFFMGLFLYIRQIYILGTSDFYMKFYIAFINNKFKLS